MARPTARSVGDDAEQLALDHLLAHELCLVERNFNCRYGEIDLVMRDGHCLVMVEVRTRRRSRFASAAGSVDYFKQRRLARAAAVYLSRRGEYCELPLRFDVVALDGQSGAKYTIQWIRDAFRPSEREF